MRAEGGTLTSQIFSQIFRSFFFFSFSTEQKEYTHFADLSIFSQIFRSFFNRAEGVRSLRRSFDLFTDLSIFFQQSRRSTLTSQIFRSFGNRPPLPPTHTPAQPTHPRFHPHTRPHTPTLPRTHAPHTHVQAHPLAHPRSHSPHTRQAHTPVQAPTHTRTRAPPPHTPAPTLTPNKNGHHHHRRSREPPHRHSHTQVRASPGTLARRHTHTCGVHLYPRTHGAPAHARARPHPRARATAHLLPALPAGVPDLRGSGPRLRWASAPTALW
jgi:hypothetical protein